MMKTVSNKINKPVHEAESVFHRDQRTCVCHVTYSAAL